MILLAAGIINRILGFIPRIALPRIIGAEGVGLFQLGYPFLFAVLTLITGGIPLAVAKLVAEAESQGNERRIRAVLSVSLLITGCLSVLFVTLCIFLASWISTFVLTDSRVYYTFLCMTPIIPIASLSAVLRGYFQGRQNMIPSAVSQVTETLVRVIMIILLAYMAFPYGIEYAAAAAMIGVVIGELGGVLVLIIQYWNTKNAYRQASPPPERRAIPATKTSTLRRFLGISIPVTGSKLIGSFSYLFESILIMQCLAIAGIATATATAQYGALTGMIIPVLYLPTALTFALSAALVPSLSEAAAKNDSLTIRKRLRQSMRLALVTGAPFAVIMTILAVPLCTLLYNDPQIGSMLKMMAPMAIFIYFQAPLNATLQALERPGTALFNTLIGAVLKLGLIWLLVSRPEWGIRGAILAMNVNIIVITLLHWRSVSKLLRFSLPGDDFVKVGWAMLFMGVTCYFTYQLTAGTSALIHFATASMLGLIVYMIVIIRLKLIDRKDLGRVPLFRKLWK